MGPHATRASRAAAWAGLGVLFATLMAHVWYSPDIWYHLFLGQRMLETGLLQPPDERILEQRGFANGYWLFQLLCRGLYGLGGVPGLSLLFAALWLGVALGWLRTARISDLPALGLPLALAALLVVQGRFEERPEIFSFFFAMLILSWLTRWDLGRRPDWPRLAALACVQALWANMHGYFVLGPALVGLRCAAALLARDRAAALGAARLLAVAALASLATPLGLENLAFVTTYARVLGELRETIQEFRAPLGPFLGKWSVQLFWLLAAGIGALAGWTALARGRRAAFEVASAALGLSLGATSIRNLPLAMLLAAPLLGAWLARGAPASPRWLERLRANGAAARASALATAALALALAGWAVHGGYYRALKSDSGFGVGLSPAAFPVSFVDWLERTGFSGRLFNVSSDGGYLEFFAPAVRIYGDSLFTDPAPVLAWFEATREPEAFLALHEREAFDGALLRITENAALALELLAHPDWELVYADLHRVFFAHRPRGAGRVPLPRELRFYRGEDLSRIVNGRAAIDWTRFWITAGQRDLLLQALRDFAAAPRIPSFVLEFGLDHAIRTRDAEAMALLIEMRPRLLALDPEDERSVDALIGSVLRPRRPG